ncbi:unnamed protein product [Prunus armeniaca]|uniref:Large ribosomal subunit protein mL54 n=1 Tax=Prunus armeniaca TaxID=36596 RepID=A0A6J5XMW0_PRUAR|nr:unnamed protein product [Prunus armeniaca]
MAMSHVKTFRSIINTSEAVGIVSRRTFAIGGGKAKKGSKGASQGDAPKASNLDKEVKSTTVVGANILKDGTDPRSCQMLSTLIGCGVYLINAQH